ncbi:hypothetical protein T08_3119, partial [Trichinella sp. T8]
LRVVSNRCSGLSLVFEERAYKLKHTRKQKNILTLVKVKIRCRSALCINVEVTDAISKKDHVDSPFH